ncbi:MAG: ABC transporter substrate-binding protein [Bacteroidota bacterium]
MIFNADYLEKHALGRTEYLKLFGALLGKEAEAGRLFAEIESNFQRLSESVSGTEKPTVFSGMVYGDTWFAPAADNWATDFITRAGGQYMYADHPGTGTLPLSFEGVYAHCLEADYWIGVGSYTSKEELLATDARYGDFAAVQANQVYSYMKRADPNGGVPYFELGYARPDLILSDMIQILQPGEPDSLNFFIPLH